MRRDLATALYVLAALVGLGISTELRGGWLPVALTLIVTLVASRPRVLRRAPLFPVYPLVFLLAVSAVWARAAVATGEENGSALAPTVAIALQAVAALFAAGYTTCAMRDPGLRRLLAYLGLACLVGFFSSAKGGSSPMEAFFQNTFHLSPSGAHEATVAVRKTIHFTFYGTVGLVAWAVGRSAGLDRTRAVLFGLSLTFALAGFDELRQSAVANRTGSAWDVVLDLTGALTFILIAARVRNPSTRAAART